MIIVTMCVRRVVVDETKIRIYFEKVNILHLFAHFSDIRVCTVYTVVGCLNNVGTCSWANEDARSHQLLPLACYAANPISISNYAKITEIILNQKCMKLLGVYAIRISVRHSPFATDDDDANEINKIVICQMINDEIAAHKDECKRWRLATIIFQPLKDLNS